MFYLANPELIQQLQRSPSTQEYYKQKSQITSNREKAQKLLLQRSKLCVYGADSRNL